MKRTDTSMLRQMLVGAGVEEAIMIQGQAVGVIAVAVIGY